MRADIGLKDVQLNASSRLLLEIIDAWDFMNWEEQLQTAQLPKEVKKKWSEEYTRKKKQENNG